jgi:hypothetical protein
MTKNRECQIRLKYISSDAARDGDAWGTVCFRFQAFFGPKSRGHSGYADPLQILSRACVGQNLKISDPESKYMGG